MARVDRVPNLRCHFLLGTVPVLQTCASYSIDRPTVHLQPLVKQQRSLRMPRNKTQRGEVRNRSEGSYGGSKHASSFIVASLARNAVRLTALPSLQVWLNKYYYSSTPAARVLVRDKQLSCRRQLWPPSFT